MSGLLHNLLIRASAGTGKTFQLSNRYLALAADGQPLDAILATTFTRKAAGEILDRILTRLAEAALDAKAAAELAGHVGRKSLDVPGCVKLLREMVRRLHRLRTGTLDSFFMQIARTFALELGLPLGWQILDDVTDARLRGEAIRRVLANAATSDVVKLMHLLTKGEAARSISQQIRGLVDGLYSLYAEAPADAWKTLPRHKHLEPEALAAALDSLAGLGMPNKQFLKARDGDVECCRCEDWETFLGKGLAAKIFAREETYYKVAIPADVQAAYEPLLRHAQAVLLTRIANQTEATARLLERFDAVYRQLKTEHRALRFEDITRQLNAADVAQRLEAVVYRLDAHVSHLLLDEFQDTSPLQWHVLRPFAQHVTDGQAARSFFCVGDVKQAIYGWRGGVAEIFEALLDELPGLQCDALNRSFRSSPVVIDVVNRVFSDLGGNGVLQSHREAAQRWSQRFQTHTTARTTLPGHCRMLTAPRAGDDEKQATVTLIYAAQRIAELHRAAPHASLGVLCRRNAAVARVIYELRTRGIEASEEGGNPLTDSTAVQVLLSALQLADHPGDTAARYHVAHSPLGPALGLADFADHQVAWQAAAAIRRRLLGDGYGRVLFDWTRTLAPICDRRDLGRLMQLVEMAYTYDAAATTRTNDFLRMVQQQRVESPSAARVRVMNVHQSKGLQFDIVVLPELDARLVGQPPEVAVGRSSPTGPVERICRYVGKDLRPLLPKEFCRLFDDYQRQVVEESLCVLYVAMTRAVHALHVILAPSAESEKKIPQTFAGVLRAALTDGARVEPETVLLETGDAQWCGVSKGSESQVPLPLRERVGVRGTARDMDVDGQGARDQTGPQAGKRNQLESSGISPHPDPLPEGEGALSATSPGDASALGLAPPSPRRSRGLDRRSPAQLEGGNQVDLAHALKLERGSLARGSLIHAWLAHIAWLDDGPPDAAALRAVAEDPAYRDLDANAQLAEFHRDLNKPAVCAALTRTTYTQPAVPGASSAVHAGGRVAKPRWAVWCERAFAVLDEAGILNGTIDRLVVLYDGQRPIGADVLDFKTDRVANEGLAARAAYYRPQVQAYRRAVAGMFGLALEHVSGRLLFLEPGVVWDVGTEDAEGPR